MPRWRTHKNRSPPVVPAAPPARPTPRASPASTAPRAPPAPSMPAIILPATNPPTIIGPDSLPPLKIDIRWHTERMPKDGYAIAGLPWTDAEYIAKVPKSSVPPGTELVIRGYIVDGYGRNYDPSCFSDRPGWEAQAELYGEHKPGKVYMSADGHFKLARWTWIADRYCGLGGEFHFQAAAFLYHANGMLLGFGSVTSEMTVKILPVTGSSGQPTRRTTSSRPPPHHHNLSQQSGIFHSPKRHKITLYVVYLVIFPALFHGEAPQQRATGGPTSSTRPKSTRTASHEANSRSGATVDEDGRNYDPDTYKYGLEGVELYGEAAASMQSPGWVYHSGEVYYAQWTRIADRRCGGGGRYYFLATAFVHDGNGEVLAFGCVWSEVHRAKGKLELADCGKGKGKEQFRVYSDMIGPGISQEANLIQIPTYPLTITTSPLSTIPYVQKFLNGPSTLVVGSLKKFLPLATSSGELYPVIVGSILLTMLPALSMMRPLALTCLFWAQTGSARVERSTWAV
ncbi:hypothetical protein QBC34DRAFT_429145 [Podospora aff. communis PSN243]|uniref:Uncharacterized protein n=1 Tax=Podospora aff. communis PSN243 TaxID=3040156 RepID=A0AAV9GE10_9PEZI|nr:hypothetical protein QBC34DRAFT_429145 [Podospora aff. communis PSN243]